MIRGMLRTTLFFSTLAQAAFADAPATAPADEQVQALIRELSDDTWSTRERAKERLVELGEQAEPHVKALLEQTRDPEVRTSAEAVLARLAEARLLGPTLISLELEGATPREAIEALEDQVGHALSVWPDSVWDVLKRQNREVNLHADRQPFWRVMRELHRQTGLWPQQTGQSGLQLNVTDSQAPRAPYFISGPFMVIATGASRSASITYGQPHQRNAQRSLNLDFFVEPKLQVLSRMDSVELTELTDGSGRPLPFQPTMHRGMSSGGPDRIWRQQISLPEIDNEPARIGKLAGKLQVMVQTHGGRLDVPDILSAREKQFSAQGRQLRIDDVQADEQSIRIDIMAALDGAASQEALRQIEFSQFELLDENGDAFRMAGGSGGGDGRTFRYELRFRRRGRDEAQGKPATLVWNFPVEGKLVEIQFEFTDLPLP